MQNFFMVLGAMLAAALVAMAMNFSFAAAIGIAVVVALGMTAWHLLRAHSVARRWVLVGTLVFAVGIPAAGRLLAGTPLVRSEAPGMAVFFDARLANFLHQDARAEVQQHNRLRVVQDLMGNARREGNARVTSMFGEYAMLVAQEQESSSRALELRRDLPGLDRQLRCLEATAERLANSEPPPRGLLREKRPHGWGWALGSIKVGIAYGVVLAVGSFLGFLILWLIPPLRPHAQRGATAGLAVAAFIGLRLHYFDPEMVDYALTCDGAQDAGSSQMAALEQAWDDCTGDPNSPMRESYFQGVSVQLCLAAGGNCCAQQFRALQSARMLAQGGP